MMPEKKQRKPLRKPDKPRIVFELVHYSDTMEELFHQAEIRGWQVFDLAINRYILPENPSPDGAIISTAWASPHKHHVNRTFDFPTVRLGHRPGIDSIAYPQILTDRYAAGQLAVDHFAERGYSHIAIFMQQSWETTDIAFNGVRDQTNERRIELHSCMLNAIQGEGIEAMHRRWTESIREYVQRLPRPLAVISATDKFAAMFSHICESLGLSIPEDIAVIGIGNFRYICEGASVPLSSVDLNHKLQLRKAMDLLESMLNGQPPPEESVIVPPKGVAERRSTDLMAISDPRVARAIRYMWNHLDWPITVDDVAYEVNMPRRSLDRAFRLSLRRGVNEELRRKRLELCCNLLTDTDMNLDQINKAIGFKSKAYLHRVFQKKFSMTPNQYRKKSIK